MVGLAVVVIDELERKRKYAFQLLLEPNEPYKAGLKAYPEDTPYSNGMAFKIASEWQCDEECLSLRRDLVAEYGEAFFLPTKGDIAREVYNTAIKTAKTAADKLKALELYANLMGFIEKPAQAVINNTNTQTTNKVMVVPKSSSDDDWESRLIEQQQKLVANA